MTTRPFDSSALPKCQRRLAKAKEVFFRCRNAKNFAEFSTHWAEFLIHSGGVLNAIEAGANGTPRGRQWHGGVKRKGRQDPLVSYMHQARNSEEHTIEEGIKHRPQEIGIRVTGYIDYLRIHHVGPQATKISINQPSGRPLPEIVVTPAGPELKPVYDPRFKQTFYPPAEHAGKRLTRNDPLYVAELYLAYLEKLVAEAAELT